jgi:hypothetical protein
MSTAWIIMVALGAAGALALVLFAWSWLAKSWQVIDDDQLAERLSRQAPGWWMRMRGWFVGGPPRLTYRRDKLGRFRKIWRG